MLVSSCCSLVIGCPLRVASTSGATTLGPFFFFLNACRQGCVMCSVVVPPLRTSCFSMASSSSSSVCVGGDGLCKLLAQPVARFTLDSAARHRCICLLCDGLTAGRKAVCACRCDTFEDQPEGCSLHTTVRCIAVAIVISTFYWSTRQFCNNHMTRRRPSATVLQAHTQPPCWLVQRYASHFLRLASLSLCWPQHQTQLSPTSLQRHNKWPVCARCDHHLSQWLLRSPAGE